MKAPVTVANPTLSASETFGGIINPVLVPIPAFEKSTDDCGIVVPTETCVQRYHHIHQEQIHPQ